MNKSGWIILDKSAGMNSRRAGNTLRRIFGSDTFGHIGTLDPFATGVLPIALGQATKMIPFLPVSHKTYDFKIQFGIKTDTDDITGETIESGGRIPTPDEISAVLPKFTGNIMQSPPAYSAVHVGGRRAYEIARSGRAVEIPARPAEIFELKMNDNETLTATCAPGTYIRSLARDIAAALGTIGVASMIRRTYSNGFGLENTIKLEKIIELFDNGADESLGGILLPVDFGLGGIPVINLDSSDAQRLLNGGFIRIDAGKFEENQTFRIYFENQFLGMGRTDNGLLKPRRLLKKEN